MSNERRWNIVRFNLCSSSHFSSTLHSVEVTLSSIKVSEYLFHQMELLKCSNWLLKALKSMSRNQVKVFFFQCVFQSHNLHLSASYHLTQSVEYLVFLFEKYGMCSIDCKAFSSSSQIKVFNRFIYNSNYNLRHLLEKLELPSKLSTHYRWDNVIKLNKIDIIKFVFMDLIKKHSCRIVDAGKNISMST